MRLFGLGWVWLAGLVSADFVRLELLEWLCLAVLALLASALYRQHPPQRKLFLLLLLFCLAGARLAWTQRPLPPDHLSHFNASECALELSGVIAAPPDVRDDHMKLQLEVSSVTSMCAGGSHPVRGRALVLASRAVHVRYGDRITATGRLQQPPAYEGFSYRDYLARRGIHSMLNRAAVRHVASGSGNPLLSVIYRLRAHVHSTIKALYPQPESSLLAGILLGIESGIPRDVREAFNRTGTAHVIAISGFNLTLLSAFVHALFGRTLGVRRGAVCALIVITLYTLLVGADAPVVRAAIMAGLALFARRIGRLTHGLASLSAAMFLMTAIDPHAPWDAGFQLSFAATLGLMLYAEPLQSRLTDQLQRHMPADTARRVAGPLGEYVLFTLAAQITTLPLTMLLFKRLSPSALLANPLILPAQPAIMSLGGISALAGALWQPLGQLLSWLAYPWLAFSIRTVELFASLPLASIELGPVSPASIVAVYLLLFLLTIQGKWPPVRRRMQMKLQPLCASLSPHLTKALPLLALLTGLTWRLLADQPDGLLHVTLLDTRGGDAVLIETPTGRFVLLDGGPSPGALSAALGRRIPLSHRRLDFLVLSGDHSDQIEGLEGILGHIPIDQVLSAGSSHGGSYARVSGAIIEAGIPFMQVQRGDTLDLGAGASLLVVSTNTGGASMLLEYARCRILILTGSDAETLEQLSRDPSLHSAAVLILADGGSAAANPPRTLAKFRPWLGLISVEAGNTRGLPSDDVLAALGISRVLRTDLHGWVEISSDGGQLWVKHANRNE